MHNILVIDDPKSADPEILKGIYGLRHKVFCDQLGWVEPNPEQQEMDAYDALPPIHIAYLNPEQKLCGCFRLKPTTGPYMLKDVFPMLVGRNELPSDPTIYEISRFAADHDIEKSFRSGTVSITTSALLVGLFKYAQSCNIKAIVGVSDVRFEKLLRRAGLYSTRYAPPRKIGNCLAVAGYADVNDAAIERLKERFHAICEEAYRHQSYKPPLHEEPSINLIQFKENENGRFATYRTGI